MNWIRIFMLYGALICGTLAYGNTQGWVFLEMAKPSHWTNQGPGSHGGVTHK
jgi:hypothetical protein